MESHTLEQSERLGYDAVIHALNVVSDLQCMDVLLSSVGSSVHEHYQIHWSEFVLYVLIFLFRN